jgi:hypothetical protein
MSTYSPDKWQIVKITHGDASHYRVFACWYGGYTSGDSWKMNSGITKVTEDEDFYHFEGFSGSVYVCHKECYGSNMYGRGVLTTMMENYAKDGVFIELLPEETNFMELKYD